VLNVTSAHKRLFSAMRWLKAEPDVRLRINWNCNGNVFC